jgi:plastocyanin
MSTTTSRTRPLAALLVAGGLVLGACATDDVEDDPPPGQDRDALELDDGDVGEDDDAATDDADVEVRNLAFEPAQVTVAVGTTVTWSNADVVRHTVTSGDPGDPDGAFDEPLAAGGTASVTFDEPGTFVYFCDLHRNMTGEVVVE